MKTNNFLTQQSNQTYYKELLSFIDQQYKTKTIYPNKKDIFNAYNFNQENIKVIIIGQDPYHQYNQANGYAFSCNTNKLPPSLKNIYKELYNDLKIIKTNGNLINWFNQGVILINTILTVEESKPLSHNNNLYDKLFNNFINYINNLDQPIVFLLWGNNAKKYKPLINNKFYILQSSHPSPLSYHKGFYNSKPFSKINNYLKINNIKPIDWSK